MNPATLAVAGLASSVVGTGVSFFSGLNAASAQRDIGVANAQMAADAARNQAAQQQMALKFQKLQQDSLAQSTSIQANAVLSSAEAATNAAQSNIRRQRQQFEALVAQQYASLGRSGVSTTTGSPIDLLMENAAAEQEQEMLMRDEDEDRRRQALREAVSLQSNSVTAGINSSLLSLESSAAGMRGKMGVSQSRIDAASATASARGMRSSAAGNLMSGLGSSATDAYKFRRDFKIKSD